MKNELIKRNWIEGNECYYKDIDNARYYYNESVNTFSYEDDNSGVIEYLCEGSMDELEKIENKQY